MLEHLIDAERKWGLPVPIDRGVTLGSSVRSGSADERFPQSEVAGSTVTGHLPRFPRNYGSPASTNHRLTCDDNPYRGAAVRGRKRL